MLLFVGTACALGPLELVHISLVLRFSQTGRFVVGAAWTRRISPAVLCEATNVISPPYPAPLRPRISRRPSIILQFDHEGDRRIIGSTFWAPAFTHAHRFETREPASPVPAVQ